MNLFKRFVYYFGGFAVGLIFVLFFLGGKKSSCSYFPNARVLKEIRFKQREISPQAAQFFETQKIDTVVIQKLLHQGKVDFTNSQTSSKEPCRVYLINGEHRKQKLQLHIQECKETDSIATITKAELID